MSDRLKDFALQLADEHLAATRAEIARLRLTDEEREAVEWAAESAEDSAHKRLMGWPADEAVANTLRGLLERLGGER